MRRSLVGLVLLSGVSMSPFEGAAFAAQPAAAEATAIAYPSTRRGDLIETQFGVQVADPYRWLETDVRNDADVRAWVDAQNKVTNAFLAQLPGRDALEKRIKAKFPEVAWCFVEPDVAD